MKSIVPAVPLLCLAFIAGSPVAAAETETAALQGELTLVLQGLSDDADGGSLQLMVSRLSDGVLASAEHATAGAEIVMTVPEEPSLVTASYVGGSPPKVLQANLGMLSAGVQAGGTAQLQFGPPTPSPPRKSYPLYPPERGKAIGFNGDEFRATGPGVEGTGRVYMDYIVVTLAQAACSDDDDSYVIVESANPRSMAQLQAEIELQQGPEFDPASRITPRWIQWTHIVRGSLQYGSGGWTADLRIEDRSGTAIARATMTTPGVDGLLDVLDRASLALVEQLCGRGDGEWVGTVDVYFKGDGADDKVTVTGGSSVRCVLKRGDDGLATCDVSRQGTIRGEDTTLTTKGGGQVRVKIDVEGDDTTTTVKVGPFKTRTTASLTMVIKTENGGSYTVSNSTEEDMPDGGWEFSGPGSAGDRRTGNWTSPDGYTTAAWDLRHTGQGGNRQ